MAKLFIVTKWAETMWDWWLVEVLIIPFMLSAIWLLTPVIRLPKWLANTSFPIYIIHMSTLLILRPILLQISFLNNLSRGAIRILVGVFGSILVAHLLRRFFPRFARVAFGER